MNNNLPNRIRAHLEECAPCLDFAECETGAMLFAQVEFEARRKFSLWIDGTETIFIPTAPECWHVRFAFNVGLERERWLTRHFVGNPAGSIKTFEQATDYARLMLMSASLDLCDYIRGIRPIPAPSRSVAAPMSRKDESKGESAL